MPVLLKLTGLDSYTSPLIDNINLKRGESIRVKDAVAARFSGGQRLNDEGEPVFYFTQVRDEKPTYDLVRPEPTIDAPLVASSTPEPEPEPAPEPEDGEVEAEVDEEPAPAPEDAAPAEEAAKPTPRAKQRSAVKK